jgi:hypothetical protein
MKITQIFRTGFFILLLCCSINIFAQDKDEPDPDADQPKVQRKSKILTGLYVGSYFANKYSASTYNGYGFDVNGVRNSFLTSFMYQKIKNEYGGGYGQHDQIADALGVDQQQWDFNESDMPVNMRYVPAILVGFNFKIPVDKKSSIILNLNGTKLSIEGNFTMTTLRPVVGTINPANNNNIKIFPIKGSEQRLLFQVGYQKIFGNDDKINFFAEAGFVGTLAKFNTNTIYINNLTIDLTYYVNQTLNPAPGPTKRPIGFGIGAYAGIGANIDMNPKFTLQLLYSPSQEKVNIGTNPALKLQNAVGFRLYYKI